MALVGKNVDGEITNSYASSSVEGIGFGVGGLVGENNNGTITNSYTTSSVQGYGGIGGIVGNNYRSEITNSYATGSVVGEWNVGGLVGWNSVGGEITNSYWDKTTSGKATSAGGVGKTTVQLQSPTTAIGIYARWSTANWDFGTRTQYPALKYRDGTLLPNQRENLPLPQIEIAGVPTSAVGEGERITLTASNFSSASSIPLSYQWEQTSGEALLIEPTSGSSVTLDVPEDYVMASASTGNVVLMLEVSSDVGNTTQQVSITISKRNNGRIAALGVPSLNERELAAPSIDLSGDPDGVGSNIRYQWQSRQSTPTAWINVPTTSTGRVHTISDDTRGIIQYRVVVSYTDGQGYREEVMSAAVIYERSVVPPPSIDIASLTSCGTADIDQDDDGLIEICNLEGLNAMRYQLDGSGYKENTSATKITAGCAIGGCKGYELAKDLDFNDDDSYSSTSNKVIWTTGEGWQPIEISDNSFEDWQLRGTYRNSFNAIFKANKYSISNLMIARPSSDKVGLFKNIGNEARLEGVGLIDVDIRGGWGVGGLVGYNSGGTITNSYVIGLVRGNASIGGLVGDNYGPITNSYTNVNMSGDNYVGGIVGCNFGGGIVTNSYTVPRINRSYSNSGGLLGYDSSGSEMVASYWDKEVSGVSRGDYGVGLTTEALQSPTTATGVYNRWSTRDWDFGTRTQYPALKYRDGTLLPNQRENLPLPQIEIAGVPTSAVGEGERITLTAYDSSSASSIPLIYQWEQTSGEALLIEPTSGSSVTLDVPEDYVVARSGTGNLVLMLGVSSDVGSTTHQVSITISKRNNGRIAAIGVPSLNERELAAPSIDLSGDPDGVGSNIRYQWQSRQSTQAAWADISATSTGEVHTIPEDAGGIVQYRVVVSYTDGQGYREQIESEALSYRGNTSPSIELPHNDSYIRLIAGQTTAVSVVISEIDTSDIVTLTIEPTSTTGVVNVEPNRISLEASLSETRITQFQLTAVQEGSVRLLLTAIDDSRTTTARADDVELIVEIEVPPLSSCGFVDIDRDNDGLIEICKLEGLDAIRYQLDGSGYRASEPALKSTIGCAEGGCKGYELAKDLDFNDDDSYSSTTNKVTWTTETGWQPIGYYESYYSNNNKPFKAILEGNNHTISKLMINRPNTDGVGLFGYVTSSTKIVNVGLLNVDIKMGRNYVGGLVGYNWRGNITNSYATGSVEGSSDNIGGLVGRSYEGNITNSYATGSVEGDDEVGGLVGANRGDITNSYATGSVEGNGGHIGGLVGENVDGEITNSYATGSVVISVEWKGSVGGLVGINDGEITNSYATGSVEGNYGIGGLVGINDGEITNSYATGNVTGHWTRVGGDLGGNYVGGLVGLNWGDITNSYATGGVEGKNRIGGLVGENEDSTITNSYATGGVEGKNRIGGLVGENVDGEITNSYATGGVEGKNRIGGLVGSYRNGEITYSYWDTETSGRTTSAGGVGKTTVQLQSPTTAIGIYARWSTANWDFGNRAQYPALKYRDGTLLPNQRENLPLPQIEIAGVPTSAVGEGERITLTAYDSSSASSIPLIYQWEQTSGEALLIEPTSGSSVTLDVPEDYVVARSGTGNLVLMLGVSSDVGSTTHQVSITISKRNNGRIAAIGEPSLNERELTAPSIDLSGDPDGVGSNIRYQWQIRQSTPTAWINVPTTSTGRVHTISDDTRGIVQYRVVVRYTDGQGYREKVRSAAVIYERRVVSPPSIDIASLTSCGTTDIDQDDDGLIEICNLEGLNAIRYQLDGSGYKESTSATKITAGCAIGGCKGYELAKDLDFDDDDSYSSTPNKVIWTTGEGWQPIGTYDNPYENWQPAGTSDDYSFNAIFRANKYSISNLMIARSFYYNNVGLFRAIGSQARLEGVGLIDVDVRGGTGVGGLVGYNNGGTIINSYVMGVVQGGSSIGGLIGDNYGPIINSYTHVDMLGNSYVGGIVGCNFTGGNVTNSYAMGSVAGGYSLGGLIGSDWYGNITNSYATGSVTGRTNNSIGGLIGVKTGGTNRHSYWDTETSGRVTSAGGVGKTTEELQSPTRATGIYSSWSTNNWDFGTRAQYPALKHRDGTLLPNQHRDRPEEPPHLPQIEIAGVPTNVVGEGERITLTAYDSSSTSSIPLIYQWEQTSGEALLIEPTSASSVTLDVPEDYVAASASTGNVVLMLKVSSDAGSTYHVSITISKRNNGQIAALGVPSLNERELVAPSIDLSGDPDGVGSNIRYQWQSRQSTQTAWVNVPTTSTGRVHAISEDTRGIVQYRVVVRYTDGQGYREKVRSAAVIYERRVVSPPSIDIASLTSCGTADIDQDNDGLIEICNLEGLNAMRYQLDGSGYKAGESATKITAGCAIGGCKGYELAKHLDFDDDDSYSSTPNKVIWTTGEGWQPIGTSGNSFNAVFRANKYSISNLMIARSFFSEVGLFGRIESQARIEGVGLIDVDVRGSWGVGGLVGYNYRGTITNSYVTGLVQGGDSIGGLIGDNFGPITNSYTNVDMVGNSYVGGIVGCNFAGGIVTNSYTVPRINRNFSNSGGLLGYDSSGREMVASYWDTEVSGISGGDYGVGLTTEALQSPTTATGVYRRWSTRDWDFGTREQYPILKYRDGTLLPDQRKEQPEEPPQVPQIEIAGVPTSAVGEGERITLTAYDSSSASSISLSYSWTQTSGDALLIEPTSGSSVTLDVPEDYVAASANMGNVVLILEASSDIGSTAHQVSITISKRNNGRIAALGVPSLNERELTTPSIDLSGDPDGVGGNIVYQWQSRANARTAWVNVPTTSTDRVHIISEDTRGIVQYRVVVRYTDGQGYREQVESEALSYEGNTIPNIEIAGVPASAVGEGERITLTAFSDSSADSIPLSYSWTQISGEALLIEPTSGSSVTLNVPEDYVAASANTSNVVLRLEASSDIGNIARQVLITISKRNNGRIAALGAPSLNERELTASSIDLSSDPDGIGGNIVYQWQSKANAQAAWVNVPTTSTDRVHIISEDTRGIVQYRVVVRYTDGQGYREQVESEALSYEGNTIPNIEIAGVPTDPVDEGERITLTAFSDSSADSIPLSYSWTQISGEALLIEPTTGSSVTLDVPEDYVAASANTVNVVLMLDASDDVGSTAQQVLITISKRNSGRIAALGVPSLNERELTAPSIDLSGDPDGVGGNIVYQWQSKANAQAAWVNVPTTSTDRVHTISEDTRGIVQYRVVVRYTDGQGYREQVESEALSYEGNTIPNIEIAGVPTDSVDEGERITLTAFSDSSANNIPLSYSWTQTSGDALLIDPTTGSSVTLDVPEDYVAASANTSNVVLILEASSDIGSTAQQVLITISKRNSGRIATLGVPSLNERELTAPSIDLSSDPDGIGGNIVYQWQSRANARTAWVNVPTTSTGRVHTISADAGGIVQYRVVVRYTDGQGYREQVESEALSYRGNISPSIEFPHNDSYIRLLAGQTTAVSVVISEVDVDDIVTLTIEPASTTELVHVEPNRISLGASLNETRITQFQLTALQEGSVKLSLTAIDNSQTTTARADDVELTVEIELSPFTSCGFVDIDRDNNGLIEICNLEGLNAMRYELDGSGYRVNESAAKITTGCAEGGCKGYELVKDLDFADDESYRNVANKAAWITGAGWQPIGVNGNSFRGMFEGNDNTISNLMIDRGLADKVGLFGSVVKPAKINGIGLIDVDINGQSKVGGLVGDNFGSITNSYVTGSVIGQLQVGGLVGSCVRASIADSYAMGSVQATGSTAGVDTGRSSMVGGLVGYQLSSSVSGSHAISTVKGTSSYVGGLIGHSVGVNGSVINSYAVVDVEGGDNYAGGLIGSSRASGRVENSYAIGRVTGENVVGGLVGYNRGPTTIMNSYSFVNVKGNSNVGGLVGLNLGRIINNYAVGRVEGNVVQNNVGGLVGWDGGRTIGSYWDKTTSGRATSSGGIGKITAQLQMPTASGSTPTKIYYNWSEEVWDFGTSEQYPALKHSDGTLIPNQRIGLLSLSALTTEELPFMFNTEVFDYRLLIGDGSAAVKLLPTATHTSASISVVSDNGFSGRVESGALSPEIPLNSTGTTVITIKVEFESKASRSYRITVSRAEQNAPAQLVGANAPFEYMIPMGVMMDDDNNMRNYEVISMPSWLSRIESKEGLMFSGTPKMNYMSNPSEQMIQNTD